MLINLSNHPLSSWSKVQKQRAEQEFGEIIDLPFPDIPTKLDLEEVTKIVDDYVSKCIQMIDEHKTKYKSERKSTLDAIHIMGEMTFVFQFVQKMSEHGIMCVASTTKRTVQKERDGIKTSKFIFDRFRPYTRELF